MAGAWPLRGRLSLGALGLSLVLLVSAAWGTGLLYLLARLGAASPVRLASIDGIHAYVGIVGGIFVIAKVARVGLRHRVEGLPNVVPWQRWLSWSMLVLYGAVFVSGVLALLPVRGLLYADLVDLHLLTSVWALLPTTWHAWHYRARAMPYLQRWAGRLAGRRFWIGLALLLVPVPALLADAPAISQLPQVLGGSTWSPVALQGSYLDTAVRMRDGTLLAAGDSLYVSRDGLVWVRIDLPATPTASTPAPATAAGSDQHAGHQHGQPAPPNAISALGVAGSQVFVGTAQGLFTSGLDGPLQQVAYPGGGVRGLAADPADPHVLWVASTSGPLLTSDAGRTWSREAAGLARPAAAAAVGYLGGDVFVSDTTGVFRWRAASRSWERTAAMPSVTALDPDPAGTSLYAGSPTDLRVMSDGRWTDLGQPAPLHVHQGVLHGQTPVVTRVDGRLYAAGTSDGVSASADGGWTWTQLGGGLGSTTPNQVTGSRDHLLAATADGLYQYPLITGKSATPAWWLAVLAAAVGLGLATTGVGALDPRRQRARPAP